MKESHGLEGRSVLHGRAGRLAEGVQSLGEMAFEAIQSAQDQPALEEGRSVAALGGLRLAFLKARLGPGDRAVEGSRGFDWSCVGGRGQEKSAEAQRAARW
jgi:hypothetical protein